MHNTTAAVTATNPKAFSHSTHSLTWPLQLATNLWSQSERGNTLAWQDPRERQGEEKGLGLEPPQETIFLSPALLYLGQTTDTDIDRLRAGEPHPRSDSRCVDSLDFSVV